MTAEDKYNNKYSVKILGEEMTVKGNISEDYVSKLAEYINEMGEEIVKTYPRLPRRHLLGLALINIVDELFKTKKKYHKIKQDNKDLWEENKKLQRKVESLKKEYEELSLLLEEVE